MAEYNTCVYILLLLFQFYHGTSSSLILTGITAKTGGIYMVEMFALQSTMKDSYVLRISDSSKIRDISIPAVSMASGMFITYGSLIKQDMEIALNIPQLQNYYWNANVDMDLADDVIELFWNGTLVDIYGSFSTSSSEWSYYKGYAYRRNGNCPTQHFNISEWYLEHYATEFMFQQFLIDEPGNLFQLI